MNTPDQKLELFVRQRNQDAFKIVYDLYYKPLCVFAYGIIKDYDESEEIVQNVMVNLWQNRDAINDSTGIKPYLFRSVHNRAINRLKHETIRQQYKSDAVWLLDTYHRDCTEHIYYRELKDELDELLNQLPERVRKAFLLSREDGKTYKEIANLLDVTVKSVEKSISKALKHLRDNLTDERFMILLLINFFI